MAKNITKKSPKTKEKNRILSMEDEIQNPESTISVGTELEKEGWAQQPLDYNAVAFRAYQIYQQRGGDALENWLEAERTLRQESSRNL